MSLSFEIVRREEAERLADLVPLSVQVPDRSRLRPPPWLELVSSRAAESEPEGPRHEPQASAQAPERGPLSAAEPDPQKLERIRHEARAEGFEEGYARGVQEGLQQAETDRTQGLTMLSNRFSSTIVQLEQVERHLVAHAEGALAELALAIAERLVRQQLTVDPALLRPILREALDRSPQVASIKLALNPIDRAVAEAELLEMQAAGGSQERQVELISDPSLDRGDVVVSTEFGLIDGRIRSQLERIRQRLQTSGELL
jgi:flagellar assembly protein FliH